jgi:hypothetical protein
MLYIYALVADLDARVLEGLRGVQGEPCTSVDFHGLTAVTGAVERVPDVSREMLEAQYALVGELHARVPALLPTRFGTAAPSAEALGRQLELRAEHLARQLALVRGREQMTLRVLGAGATVDVHARPSPLATSPGRAGGAGRRYLAARAAQAVPALVDPLLAAIQPLQRATRVEAGRHEGVVATIYHLVDRGTATAYAAAVDAAAGESPALTILLSGPSPAYAFAI